MDPSIPVLENSELNSRKESPSLFVAGAVVCELESRKAGVLKSALTEEGRDDRERTLWVSGFLVLVSSLLGPFKG